MLYLVSFIVIVNISTPVIETDINKVMVIRIAVGTLFIPITIVIFTGKNYY